MRLQNFLITTPPTEKYWNDNKFPPQVKSIKIIGENYYGYVNH